MGKRFKRRIRRAFFAAFKNWSNLISSVLITGASLVILYLFGWIEQVAWELRLLILSLIILAFIYLLIFLWFIVKPPKPKRRDANFVISYKDPQIVSGVNEGLPPAKDKMQWVQVYTNLEINYPTEIKTLELLLKGKRWIAYEWKPIMRDKMLNQQYYYFQIPTSVDLTKHKTELVASTSNEDYGSGKFLIKQEG